MTHVSAIALYQPSRVQEVITKTVATSSASISHLGINFDQLAQASKTLEQLAISAQESEKYMQVVQQAIDFLGQGLGKTESLSKQALALLSQVGVLPEDNGLRAAVTQLLQEIVQSDVKPIVALQTQLAAQPSVVKSSEGLKAVLQKLQGAFDAKITHTAEASEAALISTRKEIVKVAAGRFAFIGQFARGLLSLMSLGTSLQEQRNINAKYQQARTHLPNFNPEEGSALAIHSASDSCPNSQDDCMKK